MRYRRLSYRYAVVSLPGEQWELNATVGSIRPVARLAQMTWRPPADIYENDTAVIVTVELAGVDPDELDVLLFDDAVVVEGRRSLPADKSAVYHRAEIRQGSFRLELPLPQASDVERVDASYDHGLLQIILPKPERR